MKLLQNRRGLVLGVANDKSIAWAIATLCREQGADLILTYQNDTILKRLKPLAEQLGCAEVFQCDVASDTDIDNLFSQIESRFGGIDFIVHSLAFADKEALQNRFCETPRDKYLEAINISAFSLVALGKHARLLTRKPSSIITLSYLGAVKVVPGYNVMGVAKSALESSVRYLAYDLGIDGIRVNAISAGPIRTLASSAIRGFKSLLNTGSQIAALRRNVGADEVAKSALYLLSDLSSGITGEIHYVDGGMNIVGAIISPDTLATSNRDPERSEGSSQIK